MEDISKIFNKIKLKTYKTAKGDKYFDIIRNIFVNITPEETVRQKMIYFLIDNMNVNIDKIQVEDHLLHWNIKDFNGRMDIVLTYNDNDDKKVLAVIECKKEDIFIESMQFFEQAENYANLVESKYVILVNGTNIQIYYKESDKFSPIQGILKYEDMINNVHSYIEEKPFKRLKYELYYHYGFLKSQKWFNSIIGYITKLELVPCIANFDDCLWDYDKKLKYVKSKNFSLIDDLGIRYRQYYNSNMTSGYYRIFILQNNKTKIKFLTGFSIISNGRSHLSIMYYDGIIDKISIQMDLNKFLTVDSKNKTAMFTNNGSINRKGKLREDFIKYIKYKNSDLVKNDEIYFGKIDYSLNLTMENEDVVNLISNMVEYSVYEIEYKISLGKLKK